VSPTLPTTGHDGDDVISIAPKPVITDDAIKPNEVRLEC
jgi:hypothetical protein